MFCFYLYKPTNARLFIFCWSPTLILFFFREKIALVEIITFHLQQKATTNGKQAMIAKVPIVVVVFCVHLG